jgi:hypothetical protein
MVDTQARSEPENFRPGTNPKCKGPTYVRSLSSWPGLLVSYQGLWNLDIECHVDDIRFVDNFCIAHKTFKH